jgi:hypothetical protein
VYFRALAVAALLAPPLGCFVDDGAATPDPTSTTTSTTAAPTTGLVDPSTTTSTADPTTSNADTDLDPTTGELTTGVAPESCWDQGAAGWPDAGIPIDQLGMESRDASLTPDGLSLYYTGTADQRFWRSSRLTLTDPFSVGTLLAKWSDFTHLEVSYPSAIIDERELLFSADGDIYAALAGMGSEGDLFSSPEPLPAPVNTPEFRESNPTATNDGTLLIVQREDGPQIPQIPELTHGWQLYQFERPGAPDGGEPFTGGINVTPLVGTSRLVLCPILSPDGLHLFFSSTEADDFSLANVKDIDVYYTSRADRLGLWTNPQRLTGFNDVGVGLTCAAGVTKDGCQLTYSQAELLAPPAASYLATRAASP